MVRGSTSAARRRPYGKLRDWKVAPLPRAGTKRRSGSCCTGGRPRVGLGARVGLRAYNNETSEERGLREAREAGREAEKAWREEVGDRWAAQQRDEDEAAAWLREAHEAGDEAAMMWEEEEAAAAAAAEQYDENMAPAEAPPPRRESEAAAGHGRAPPSLLPVL